MSSSKIYRFSETELQELNAWTGLRDFNHPHSENIEPEEATRTLTVDEIEAMQKQAYEEAFAQGRAEGFEQGKAEGFVEGQMQGMDLGRKQGYEENLQLLQKQAAEFVLLMETLTEPFQKLDAAVEAELLSLVIAIAGQIIRREIKLDPGQIIGVIREAVKALPVASPRVTLTLHPEDAELVRTTLKLDESLQSWRLQESPVISRGGCTVETEMSKIDATVEKRLASVVAQLLGGEREQDVE
jgi:flagellar assembly protein FliH